MAKHLSDYEKQRLETIRKNKEIMAAMGIFDAKDALNLQPKPKVAKPRKPKPEVPPSKQRCSRRLSVPLQRPALPQLFEKLQNGLCIRESRFSSIGEFILHLSSLPSS